MRPSFLCVDHFAETFKAYFLFFLMTAIISPYEFMSLAFIGSVVSGACRSLPTLAGYKIPFFGGGTDRTHFVTLNGRVMARMIVSRGDIWFFCVL